MAGWLAGWLKGRLEPNIQPARHSGRSADLNTPCYRDIMLGSVPGKKCFSIVRKSLLPFASFVVGLSQFGSGFNGGETAFAHLYLRLLCDYARKIQMSCAILFLDVSSAFASLLRRIIFDDQSGDEAWLKQLKDAGYSNDDISHIWNSICSTSWHDLYESVFQSGPQQFSFLYAQSVYFNTWFTQESLSCAVSTSRGCMAGMTFADIVYAMCFAPLLKSLRQALSQNSIFAYCHHGSPSTKTLLHEASYADDVIIPCYCKCNCLISNMVNTAKIANGVFNVYGLSLNFKPGKSEVLPLLLGSGSARQKLIIQQNSASFSLAPEVPGVSLRFVSSYKHMGTTFSVVHDSKAEVSIRSAYMISGLKSFSKVFNAPNAPITRKMNIAKAYTLTGGTYQCGTWPELCKASFSRFHHTILKIYRVVTNTKWATNNNSNPFSDQDVIYHFNLITPSVIIRFARLSLFFRACSKSVFVLKVLIAALSNCNKGWIAALNNDCKWFSLCSNAPKIGSIQEFLELDPAVFPQFIKCLRKFAKSPFANLDAQLCYPELIVNPSNSEFMCVKCHSVKATRQACNLHMFKCFGYKDPIRKYVPEDSVTCDVCLVRFWTRERLLNHLRYRSSVCYHNYILRGPQINSIQADDIDLNLRSLNSKLYKSGHRRHYCESRAIREHGPLLPIILPFGSQYSAHHPLGKGHNYRCA